MASSRLAKACRKRPAAPYKIARGMAVEEDPALDPGGAVLTRAFEISSAMNSLHPASPLAAYTWRIRSAVRFQDACASSVAPRAERVRVLWAMKRSMSPIISADGRFLAFASRARLLSSARGTGSSVYVLDLMRHTLTIESPEASGWLSSADSRTPAISADGRFVVFE